MIINIESFRNIVDKIELNIEKNKITTLIGNNGVGKSNILSAIFSFNNAQKNTDVSFTSNFDGDEDEIISRKSISIEYELPDDKKNEIISILKEISIDISKNRLIKFDWKQCKIIQSKVQLSSSLSEIFKLIHNSKRELIGDKYLFEIDNDDQYEIDLEQIEKALNNKSLNNKSNLLPILKSIKRINDIFNERPEIIFIKNSDNVFNLEHLTDIVELENNSEIGKRAYEILYFIGGKSLDDAKSILMINNQSKNELTKIENAKKRIVDLAMKKINNIFEYFDLYGKPVIKFDGTQISVSIDFEEETIYGESIDLKNNSDGFKSILNFLIKLEYSINYSKTNNVELILMVDELDKNIHPISQIQLIEYLNNKIKNSNIHLIITTHSPFLLNSNLNVSNFYVIDKENLGNVRVSELNNISDNITSSFLVLSERVLNSNSFLMKLNSKKIVFLESENQDDIQILKAKINKSIGEVKFCLFRDSDVLIDDVSSFISDARELNDLEKLLIENKKVLVKKEFLEKIRKED